VPLYDFRCEQGHVEEHFRRYEARHDPLACATCGGAMAMAFLPPQVMRDLDGYQSMVDGSWIGSRSEHRDHLKRHSLRELGNDKPDFTPRGPRVPRDSIRAEIRNTVEAMKAGGRFRER
jgi:hypothetical protein